MDKLHLKEQICLNKESLKIIKWKNPQLLYVIIIKKTHKIFWKKKDIMLCDNLKKNNNLCEGDFLAEGEDSEVVVNSITVIGKKYHCWNFSHYFLSKFKKLPM